MAKKKRLHQDNIAYWMISPYYCFLAIFILLPIIINIVLGFTNYDMTTIKFTGLSNYSRMLTDPNLKAAIINTFIYTIATLILTMLIGLFTAIALIKVSRGTRFFRTMIFMPYVVSMASAAMIWLWMYDPGYGFFNGILDALNLSRLNWVYDVNLALGSVIAVTVWKFLGFNMVIFTSGLLGIPGQLYEAATIDGANAIQRLYYITVPMLRPTTFFLMVTGFINNFNVFEQVNILTRGGPMNATTTIMHQVYIRAFVDYKMGYASAITVLLIVIVSIVTAFNFRYGSQGQDLDLS